MSESRPRPDGGVIHVYWKECRDCGYTTVASGRVLCPRCRFAMHGDQVAGAFVPNGRPA